ncbi:MAG: hypothetical protein L0Z62_35855 [Gemmataceae bacterium]|nr:hypothetical protein [Gemmataceae bacterium]
MALGPVPRRGDFLLLVAQVGGAAGLVEGELGLALSPELAGVGMGLEQGLLDDVGGIELALELPVQLQPSQQMEIVAVALQRPAGGVGGVVHRGP